MRTGLESRASLFVSQEARNPSMASLGAVATASDPKRTYAACNSSSLAPTLGATRESNKKRNWHGARSLLYDELPELYHGISSPMGRSAILIGPNIDGKSNILRALVTALEFLSRIGGIRIQKGLFCSSAA